MSRRQFGIRTRTALLALFALAATVVFAGGQEKAPRRPPEPFRVFVYAIETADAGLKTQLGEALPMVRERVAGRRKWFQLAASADAADITIRIVSYRTGELRDHPNRRTGGMIPGMLTAEPSDCREYHFVDAVVRRGGVSTQLSGLDAGAIGGAGLGRAAGQLAKELERFAKDNYGALSQHHARARTQ